MTVKKRTQHGYQWWWLISLLCLAACTTNTATPTPTPIVIAKFIATVYISPTPNEQQGLATRFASSPTAPLPSPTVSPTATAYVGVFIGEAQRDAGRLTFTEALFQPQATGVPTANATVCRIPIEPAYLQAWQTEGRLNQLLGCPIQQGFGFFGEVQIFENGVMYRNTDTRDIWAVISDSVPARYTVMQSPPSISTAGITPPLGGGFLTPSGDFGSLWMGVEGLREAIGFAVSEPQRVGINLQRYNGGTFLLDLTSGQIFAFLADGTALGPFNLPSSALLTPTVIPLTETPTPPPSPTS